MAPIETVLDPRLSLKPDVRPVVAVPRQGLPTWLLVLFALALAFGLFAVLDARRQSASRPVPPETAAVAAYAPPPPLYTPPQSAPALPPGLVTARAYSTSPAPVIMRSQAAPPQSSQPSASAPRQVQSFASDIPSSPPVIYNPQQEMSGFQSPPPQRADGGAALVVDTTSASAAEAAGGAAGGTIGAAEAPAGSQAPSAAGATLGARARAGTLANRSATVPQGTLIPAVIETAFNSNRGGFARAMVSRDVRGFDGSRVLIPRGSRLIGEYRADVAPGQRRALVNWVRLVRPDGVTMTIASPSTDTLGRAGMRANVNTHFFQRFGGALLRSVIDIGASYATIRGRGSPVVLLPGAAQGATGGDDNQLRPTLTVPAGRSISVFVARNLDFGGAGGRE